MSRADLRRIARTQIKTLELGTVPGIYLRPERNSPVQFAGEFLSSGCHHQAGVALTAALDRLFAAHGEKKIAYYVERSLGLDVFRKVAWCNLDITDDIVP